MELNQKHCLPCQVGGSSLKDEEEEKFMDKMVGWNLVREGIHKIKKEFKFKNFKEAMGFVNEVAKIAEQEGHHPDIYVYYNKVNLELYSHAMKGLSENDFIVAAKIDVLNS